MRLEIQISFFEAQPVERSSTLYPGRDQRGRVIGVEPLRVGTHCPGSACYLFKLCIAILQTQVRTCGTGCVIAKSFARIFYRNAINIGMPILECEQAAEEIQPGDEVTIDFDTGVISNITTGKRYQAEPFPEFIQNIIKKGGLLASLKEMC